MSDRLKKGNMSHDASSLDELPPLDEPMGISSDESLLRPAAPKGTSLNRRLVLSLITVSSVVIVMAIMQAFSPSKPKPKPQPAVEVETTEALPEVATVEQNGDSETPDAEKLNSASQNPYFQQQQPVAFPPVPPNGAINDVWPYSQGTNQFPVQPDPASIPAPAPAGDQIASQSQQQSLAQKERQEVRRGAIRFGAGSGTASNSAPQEKVVDNQIAVSSSTQSLEQEKRELEGQARKEEFLKQNHSTAFYSRSDLRAPVSMYEVKAGTIIPSLLITGINSDLPGYVVAQVRENVYDTVTGKYLLIPQGSRLIGTYDSRIMYAQSRLLIVWTRLIYPNGYSIDLEGMPGIDGSGYAGVKDRVNYHTGKLAAGIILSSFMAAGARVAADKYDGSQSRVVDLAGQGAAEGIIITGNRIAERNLNVQPTIQIRPGFTFNVFVYKDLVLAPYQQ